MRGKNSQAQPRLAGKGQRRNRGSGERGAAEGRRQERSAEARPEELRAHAQRYTPDPPPLRSGRRAGRGGGGAGAAGLVSLPSGADRGRPALRGPSASGPAGRGAVPVGAEAEAGAAPPCSFVPVRAPAASVAGSAQPRVQLVQ